MGECVNNPCYAAEIHCLICSATPRTSKILPARLLQIVLAFVLLVSSSVQANSIPLLNHLKDSPSPYLAIHGDDPVAWQEWNSATLERARRENKLLYVSIGYFSCHWCHVMQAESYRNAEIAAYINQNFIPVKVDREIDVALDAEMIAFAQRTLGSAGWPLNVYITPEGYPLYANLYEKPERFMVILSSLAKEWQADSAGLKTIAQKSVQQPYAKKKLKLSKQLADKYRIQLVQESLAQADLMSGGLNVSRKFPISPQISALLEIVSQHHDAKLAEWIRLTLDQMMNSGLRDHLAGGFFRYTVDPLWQRPHFEKMLYDNAQLAMIYLRAAKVFNYPAYRDIAMETLDFMLNDMQLDGAFITSISALDDKGIEGGAYLWNEEQLKSVLDANEYALVARLWGMNTAAEFDSGYLPMNHMLPTPDEQQELKHIYPKLMQIRRQKVAPKDIKLLAGLNGLALEAFSEAAELAPRYRKAADDLHRFLIDKLYRNGELYKGISRQQILDQGDLESYAFTAAGLVRYSRLSASKADREQGSHMAQLAWQKFYTPQGFLLEQRSELARPYYQAVVEDGPLPSPSSVLIKTSLLSGDKVLLVKAKTALGDSDVAGIQERGLFWIATQVAALNRLFGSREKP